MKEYWKEVYQSLFTTKNIGTFAVEIASPMRLFLIYFYLRREIIATLKPYKQNDFMLLCVRTICHENVGDFYYH